MLLRRLSVSFLDYCAPVTSVQRFCLISGKYLSTICLQMVRKGHILIALVILVAIGIVLFAPSVDLEPTAMRAAKAASIIFLAIAAVAQIVTSLALPSPRASQIAVVCPDLWSSLFEIKLIDLNCTRLC